MENVQRLCEFSGQTAEPQSSGYSSDSPPGEMHRSPWALFVCLRGIMGVWVIGEAPFPGA